ncbi:MAG TPA: HU family DNA-binding protein [Thermodesulfobacteriota bacterium]|nr:HU family DNA-binding protein [Thermodesulfobacteriota bacterium]
MARSMTKVEVVKAISESTGLSQKDVSEVLEKMAELAYKEAGNSFTIPGIGKLVLVDRAERMGRNPRTGETIRIPAKKAVKFRVSKVCKDAVLGGA